MQSGESGREGTGRRGGMNRIHLQLDLREGRTEWRGQGRVERAGGKGGKKGRGKGRGGQEREG